MKAALLLASAIASITSLLAMPGTARAEDEAPAASPAPAPSAAPTTEPQTSTEGEEEARFRWGISGFGGPLAGGLGGGAGGIDVRVGAQLSNKFGIYGQPVVLFGAGADASTNGASASAVALAGTGVLADLTLADLFYVAVGPEVLFGAMGSASSSATTNTASGSSGAHFSVTARAGFAFGSMQPERRKAFTVGLDFRTIFNPGDPVLVPCLALGYDAF